MGHDMALGVELVLASNDAGQQCSAISGEMTSSYQTLVLSFLCRVPAIFAGSGGSVAQGEIELRSWILIREWTAASTATSIVL